VRVLRTADKSAVAFARGAGGDPAVIEAGGAAGGLTLAWVGERLLVLTDGDVWDVVPAP
jgi:hypothetical protein